MHRFNSVGRKTFALMKLAVAIGITATTSTMAFADTCYVDVGAGQQTIDGIGFSSAWCGTLTSAKNNALYNTLGMSLLRVQVDPGSNWDAETANAAAAHAAGAKVLGSTWFGPSQWTGTRYDSSGNSQTYLLPEHYGDFANWLKSAVTYHNLDWISPANEPDLGWMAWTSDELKSWIGQYGGSLGKPLLAPESCWFADGYTNAILDDSAAGANISIVGGHGYGGPSYHSDPINKGKHCWMTEHFIQQPSAGTYDIGVCMDIAKEVSDYMNDQFSAYIWWSVNDQTDISLAESDGSIDKAGYTLGQFSKWIRPGYVRCSSTYNPTSSVYVTSYYGSNNVVIVAVNTGSSSVNQTFSLQNASVGSFSAYRTSNSENMAGLGSVSPSNSSFSYSLPAQSVTTFVGQFQSGNGPANGTYKLIARHSGKAMDAYGLGTSNGTQICQWTYGGGSNQKWTLTDTGSGNYKLIGVASGKALDIDYSSGGTANGTKVELWDYWAGPSQLYKFTATDSGYYRITPNCASGSCLDVSGASTADGALVQLWQWGGGSNQQWALQTDAPANGTYKIISRNSGKAMDAYGAGTSNGTQIIQWTYGGGSNQKWTLTDTGSGNYKIIGVASGKALDIYNGATANGTKVELWDFGGGSMQLFKFAATDSGYYRLTPNCATGSCLDVKGGSTSDGAVVQLYQWTGGSNQQWVFQAP